MKNVIYKGPQILQGYVGAIKISKTIADEILGRSTFTYYDKYIDLRNRAFRLSDDEICSSLNYYFNVYDNDHNVLDSFISLLEDYEEKFLKIGEPVSVRATIEQLKTKLFIDDFEKKLDRMIEENIIKDESYNVPKTAKHLDDLQNKNLVKASMRAKFIIPIAAFNYNMLGVTEGNLFELMLALFLAFTDSQLINKIKEIISESVMLAKLRNPNLELKDNTVTDIFNRFIVNSMYRAKFDKNTNILIKSKVKQHIEFNK